MTLTGHTPDDLPEFDLRALEDYLAAHPDPTAMPATARKPATASENDGRTRRVRKLAAAVAEAHHLARLQHDTVLVTAHTPRVLRTIRRGAEAVKLVELRRNPAFAALAVVRARRFVTITGLTALVIALGWSTAGVQAFAADTAPTFSPHWWFAWAVEPFVSLALLTVVIARAFLASRGHTLTSPTARRVEWLFLALTLLMNTWRHLPGVAHPFVFGQLIIHALGPIVAVSIVTVLPVLWAALDHTPLPDRSVRNAGPSRAPVHEPAADRVAHGISRITELVRDGRLPPSPSANRIHKELGGAMDTARAIRDALRRHQPP